MERFVIAVSLYVSIAGMMNQNKDKLLVFHGKLAPYRVDLFNSLASRFQMEMHVDLGGFDDSLFSSVESECHFNYKTFSSSDGLLSTIRYVRKAIKDSEAETVLVPECGLVSLIVFLYKKIHRKGYRLVSMIDDSYDMLVCDNQFSRRHAIAEKILIPRFDDVICVEPRVASFFKNKYGKGIYFPIIRDEVKYRKELEASLMVARDLKKQYGLEGKKVILFVGRFVAVKNVTTLIQVAQSIDDDSLRLVLVGDGPEKESYIKVAETDKVIFPGKLTGMDLYAWYNIASVFVLPSVREPFGAVVNEALMSGCKCVVSQRAGSSCLVQEGVNGYCFDPLDVQIFKTRLEVLLQQVDGEHDLSSIKPSMMRTSFEYEFGKVLDAIKKKPRILLMLPLPPPVHGASVVSQQIKESMALADVYDCEFLNLSTSKKIDEINHFKIVKLFRYVGMISKLCRKLLSGHYELCYLAITCHGKSFLKDAPFVLLGKLFGEKIVIHQHNKGMSKDICRWPYRWLLPLCYRDTKVILLSWYLYSDIERVVPRENVQICPNGIKVAETSISRLCHNRVLRLLFLSNLIESKGVIVLLDALRLLADTGYLFRCDFVGEETKEIDAIRFSKEVGNRQLNSFVFYNGKKTGEEKERFLDEADIFVLPTFNDCFPLVLLEAMSHGLPIVTTAEGGIPDMIEDGINGLICDRNNPDALAASIAKLMTDDALRRKMGDEGFNKVNAFFNDRVFERQLITCLNAALGIQ